MSGALPTISFSTSTIPTPKNRAFSLNQYWEERRTSMLPLPGFPWGANEDFAADPTDGSIVYPKVITFEREIELLHLARQ
jgi:hypothetical protein